MTYEEFLAAKAQHVAASGFAVDAQELCPAVFDCQRAVVRWVPKKGKAWHELATLPKPAKSPL